MCACMPQFSWFMSISWWKRLMCSHTWISLCFSLNMLEMLFTLLCAEVHPVDKWSNFRLIFTIWNMFLKNGECSWRMAFFPLLSSSQNRLHLSSNNRKMFSNSLCFKLNSSATNNVHNLLFPFFPYLRFFLVLDFEIWRLWLYLKSLNALCQAVLVEYSQHL